MEINTLTLWSNPLCPVMISCVHWILVVHMPFCASKHPTWKSCIKDTASKVRRKFWINVCVNNSMTMVLFCNSYPWNSPPTILFDTGTSGAFQPPGTHLSRGCCCTAGLSWRWPVHCQALPVPPGASAQLPLVFSVLPQSTRLCLRLRNTHQTRRSIAPGHTKLTTISPKR